MMQHSLDVFPSSARAGGVLLEQTHPAPHVGAAEPGSELGSCFNPQAAAPRALLSPFTCSQTVDYPLVCVEGRGVKDLIGSGLMSGAAKIIHQLCWKNR